MKYVLALLALVACEKSAPPKKEPSPFDGIDLPVLAASPSSPVGSGPVLVATKTGIVFEGLAVVSITNGMIDPADKEGGTMGLKIPRLTQILGARRPEGVPLLLALDRTLPYQAMIEVMFSAKQPEAGWKTFQVLAKSNNKVGGFAITLPDKKPPEQVDMDPANQPVKLIVTASRTEILVWSLSQREGSLENPKARIAFTSPTAMADLAAALAPLAQRYPAEKEIILQADGATPLQRVAELLGALTPSFPDVVFSSGFE